MSRRSASGREENTFFVMRRTAPRDLFADHVGMDRTRRLGVGTAKRLLGLALLSMLLGTLFSGPVRAAEGCSPITVESFEVEVMALRDVYALGDTAKLRVTVTRGGGAVDLGAVEGAHVLLTLTSGRVLATEGVTDHHGMVRLSLRLAKVAAGAADVSVSATKEAAHCVQEAGDEKVTGLFRIVR